MPQYTPLDVIGRPPPSTRVAPSTAELEAMDVEVGVVRVGVPLATVNVLKAISLVVADPVKLYGSTSA